MQPQTPDTSLIVNELFNKPTKQRRLIVETYSKTKPNTLRFACSIIKNLDINYDMSIVLINSVMDELVEINEHNLKSKLNALNTSVEEITQATEKIYKMNSSLFSSHISNCILKDQIITTLNSLNKNPNYVMKGSSFLGSDVLQPLENLLNPQTYENCGINKMEEFVELFIKNIKDSDYSFKEFHNILNKIIQKIPQKQVFFELSIINNLDGKKFRDYEIVVPKSNYDLIDVGLNLHICVGNRSYEERILQKRGYVLFLKKNDQITNCIEVSLEGHIIQFVESRNQHVRGALREEFKNFINYEVKFEAKPLVIQNFITPSSIWNKIINFF